MSGTHLQMVVWTENHPTFDTAEGVQQIDRVASCKLSSQDEGPELHDLVKNARFINIPTHVPKTTQQ